MAIDSRNKRFSLLGFGNPYVKVVFPDPDGSFDSNDRAHLSYLYAGIDLAGAVIGPGVPGGRGRPFVEVPVRTTRGIRRTKLHLFEKQREEEKRLIRDVPIQAFTDSLKDVAQITALRKIQQFEEQSFKQELVRIDREIEEKEAVHRAMMIANLDFDLKMTAIRRREEELILIFIIRNVL